MATKLTKKPLRPFLDIPRSWAVDRNKGASTADGASHLEGLEGFHMEGCWHGHQRGRSWTWLPWSTAGKLLPQSRPQRLAEPAPNLDLDDLSIHLQPWRSGLDREDLTLQLMLKDVAAGHAYELIGGEAKARQRWAIQMLDKWLFQRFQDPLFTTQLFDGFVNKCTRHCWWQWLNAPHARQVLGTDLEELYLSQTQGKRKVDGETMLGHERKSKYEGHYGSLGYMLVRCKAICIHICKTRDLKTSPSPK